jgi:Ca2+-binding EF-hand superfamily protein
MMARVGAALIASLIFLTTSARLLADDAASDAQDLVLLGPTRPVLLRLRITLDGKPFRAQWQARFDELFEQEDRDHDGRLSAQQAASLAGEMHGSLGDMPSGDLASHLTDGTIDRAALLKCLDTWLPNISLKRRAAIGQGSALALFPLLDTDGNRQLSAAELDAAEKQLIQRDFNDDGVISAAELILDPNAIAAAADPAAADRSLNDQEGAAILISPGTTPENVAARLLAHYDSNRDSKLDTRPPQAEIVLPASSLGRLDANGDGQLDAQELQGLVQLSPDMELPFSFGQVSGAASRKRPPAPPAGFKVRKTLQGGFDLDLGDAQVKFTRDNRDPRQTDFVEFRTFDRDGNSYVDLAEAQMGNIGKKTFAAMDIDGDGKIFKGELSSFVGRQNEAAAVRFQLNVTDIGQDLRKLLDLDEDFVLSARELRMARNVLTFADTNGDGVLGGDEIPQDFVLELVRGLDERSDPLRVRTSGGTASQAASAGPLWFRKMDRNNDGDLSPREFIGPRSAFQKLDANGDGLIDRDEAEAAAKS